MPLGAGCQTFRIFVYFNDKQPLLHLVRHYVLSEHSALKYDAYFFQFMRASQNLSKFFKPKCLSHVTIATESGVSESGLLTRRHTSPLFDFSVWYESRTGHLNSSKSHP